MSSGPSFDIFDLIAKGELGTDGLPKPKPRSRNDIMVARVTGGQNLIMLCEQLRAYLSFFEHLVQDKSVRLTTLSSSGMPRDIPRKELAKIYISYYIEMVHAHNNLVVNPPKPGEPPLDYELIVGMVMLQPEVQKVVALEW